MNTPTAMRFTVNLFFPLTVCIIEVIKARKPNTAARKAKVGLTKIAKITDSPASRTAQITVLLVLAFVFDFSVSELVKTKLHDSHT